MAQSCNIFGCIYEYTVDWAVAHNDAVIESLPATDADPLFTRGMVTTTGSGAQTGLAFRRILIACSIRHSDDDIEERLNLWIDKLEGFLNRLCFAQADICFTVVSGEDGGRLHYRRPLIGPPGPDQQIFPFVTWCYQFNDRRAEHGAVFNAVCHRPGYLPKPPDCWKEH